MDTYAPGLYHQSYYDNSIEMNALSLLAYSLDNKSQGINCRNKAQILNEMCLALVRDLDAAPACYDLQRRCTRLFKSYHRLKNS